MTDQPQTNVVSSEPEGAMAQNGPKWPNQSAAKKSKRPNVGLSGRQWAALELMAVGRPDSEIARILKVGRRTLFRWKTDDPAFLAELKRHRKKQIESAADRVRSLLETAINTLGRQVQDVYDPTSHRAARTLLTLARVGDFIVEQGREEAAEANDQ